MNEIRMLRMKTTSAILSVTAIGVVLVFAGRTDVTAVGLPFFLALFAVEYAGARAALGKLALRRDIEALRSRPAPPAA